MVILYVYLRIWTKKSPIYRADMLDNKLLKQPYIYKKYFRQCVKEKRLHTILGLLFLRICVRAKEVTA